MDPISVKTPVAQQTTTPVITVAGPVGIIGGPTSGTKSESDTVPVSQRDSGFLQESFDIAYA